MMMVLAFVDLNALMEEYAVAIREGDFTQKGWPHNTYAVSKMGVSMLTRIFARDFSKNGILFNAWYSLSE